MKILWIYFDFSANLLCLVALSCLCLRVVGKPVPGESVTQTGEPSHFQVDDRAAEIEVNANPAGVKVNAKPASLQVVAKPGTPAVPIFHPSIHMAPHFEAPPMIYHQPAMFYHHGDHFPYSQFHHGHSLGWSYLGLKRNQLPSVHVKSDDTNERKKERSHKSDIPHIGNKVDISTTKRHSNRKRQLIQAPPLLQPSSYGTLSPFGLGPLQQYAPMVPSFDSVLQHQGSQPSFQESPYLKSGIPAAEGAPFQLPQPQTSSAYGLYGGSEADIAKLYQALLGQAAMYAPISQGGESLYDHQGQMPPPQPSQESPLARSSFLGYGQPFMPPPLTNQFAVQPSIAATVYPGTNGLFYVPSPLAQLYGAQPSSPINSLLGRQVLGQRMYSPYLTRPAMMSRSKVPRMPHHRRKHKRSVDSQENHEKRQMIINPALFPSSVQQYRNYQPVTPPFIGQRVSPLLPQQQPSLSTSAQSPILGSIRSPIIRPVLPFAQARARSMASTQSPMFSTAMSPLISRAPPYLPQSQASSYPLENEGYHNTLPSLESLSANLVTPIEGFRSRALRPMSRPMTSSFAPNLLSSFAPLRMRSRFDSSSTMSSFRPLRREQNYPSLLTLPRRSHFRHSLHYGRFPHWRKFSRRPLYRRRLHSHKDYDDQATNALRSDRDSADTGEAVTQVGGYTVTDDNANKAGQVLVDRQNVGFGPITVEAKTAQGLKKAWGDEDFKRNNIPVPQSTPFINHPR